MDEVTKGVWLVNSYKHLLSIRQDAAELSSFEATDAAGKAGTLLARLVADQSEVVPSDKVRAFARRSGIRVGELLTCLQYLRDQGKIDYVQSAPGQVPAVEVYCFSTKDALVTTSRVYDSLGASDHEQASLVSLGETFLLPRSDEELVDSLTGEGFPEEVATTTLKLQETLGLVKVTRGPEFPRPVFYNEHAFAGDPEKTVRALQALSTSEKQEVEEIQGLVDGNPGYPLDQLERVHSKKILRMMEGVGLLDGVEIDSQHAQAVFVTGPQLRGISIGLSPLAMDVFHKAKVLLSCLRFGQLKSDPRRGRIISAQETLHIINKLIRGDWVGPCTAIGEDYKLLELDGVIETRPVTHDWYKHYSMYEMRLREKEVGLLVRQMLQYGRVLADVDVEFSHVLAQEPAVSYEIPEVRRRDILATATRPVKEIQDKLMLALRTGLRRA